jgi:hypothetical protein
MNIIDWVTLKMPLKNIKDLTTKEALIMQMELEGKTSYEMALHNGLASRTIRRFKEKRAKGIMIYCKDGRPRIMDEISEESVADWINENPHYDRPTLQAKILEECEATFMRRNPLYVNNDRRRKRFASRHTVYRYYHYFHTFNGILLT